MNRSAILVTLLALLLVASVAYLRLHRSVISVREAERDARSGCRQVAIAFRDDENDLWLTAAGRVSRLLPDSSGRYRHQRFILRCASGLTVLIVNDVSIGRRAPVLTGRPVAVHGEYVWNAEGGLIHFTHHDPGGGTGGWILFAGRVYS